MIDDKTSRATTVQPEGDVPERRRTVLVWLIFVWICFAALSGIVAVAMVLLGMHPGGAAAPQFSAIYYVISLIAMVFYFVGGLALFNLRAKAVKFFSIGLAFTVAGGLYSLSVMRPEDYPPPPPGTLDVATWQHGMWAVMIGGIVLALAIYVAILAYAVRLRRRGILI